MKKILSLLTTLLLIAVCGNLYSQCKVLADKCTQDIRPYRFAGQGNYKVSEGKSVELNATFYSGENYRLLLCSPDYWKKFRFNIYDSNRKLLFTNKLDESLNYWDFKPKKTENYIVEMIIPYTNNNKENARNGCVALLIGFK